MLVLHHLCDHTVVFSEKKERDGREQFTSNYTSKQNGYSLFKKEYLLLVSAEARPPPPKKKFHAFGSNTD